MDHHRNTVPTVRHTTLQRQPQEEEELLLLMLIVTTVLGDIRRRQEEEEDTAMMEEEVQTRGRQGRVDIARFISEAAGDKEASRENSGGAFSVCTENRRLIFSNPQLSRV